MVNIVLKISSWFDIPSNQCKPGGKGESYLTIEGDTHMCQRCSNYWPDVKPLSLPEDTMLICASKFVWPIHRSNLITESNLEENDGVSNEKQTYLNVRNKHHINWTENYLMPKFFNFFVDWTFLAVYIHIMSLLA